MNSYIYKNSTEVLNNLSFSDYTKQQITGNSCAVRQSIALWGGAPDIMKDAISHGLGTATDSNGRQYLTGADKLAVFLGVTIHGKATYNRVYSYNEIKGRCGIIYVEGHHIDTFDGKEMLGNKSEYIGEPGTKFTTYTIYFREFKK